MVYHVTTTRQWMYSAGLLRRRFRQRWALDCSSFVAPLRLLTAMNDRVSTFDKNGSVATTDPVPSAQLKPLRSFLIHGDYSPAHPINLCLSRLEAREKSDPRIPVGSPLLITAQPRSKFIEALTGSDLAKTSGLGRMSGLLAKIRIYYPETPNHWMLLLSLLHVRNLNSDLSKLHESPFPIDSAVSMLVLHEPSAYFLGQYDSTNQTATIDQYLRLVMAGFACSRSLQCGSGEIPPLVLFDSKITRLKLSILPSTRLTHSDESYFQTVLSVAEQYFDRIEEIDSEHGKN